MSLKIHWVPGHVDLAPNKKAHMYVKKAVKGISTRGNDLLKLLKKPLPGSIAFTCYDLKLRIYQKCIQHWKMSPRYTKTYTIHKSTASKKWLKLVMDI